jgi:AcrR family transcriptional regulator
MAFSDLDTQAQNRIINSACEVFAKYGYQKASMRDIAETAGVSKSVLFKYFSTKENLYTQVFRITADSIINADADARLTAGGDADIFSLIRASTHERMKLFAEYPWFYRFSYSAAFDPDPFVQDMVHREYADYFGSNRDGTTQNFILYRGLRDGVAQSEARQLVLWVSQGYLEEKLHNGDTDPENLRSGFERWVDILELLLAKDRPPERPADKESSHRPERRVDHE